MAGCISVQGGPVWQWDTGRAVEVRSGTAERVHFARPDDEEALVVETVQEGGRKTAEIPTQLLSEPGTVTCWIWEDGRTTASLSIPVVARPRPSDWVYTPTQVETVESLKEWVEERIGEIETTGGLEVGHGLKVLDGKITVDTADAVEADNTLPITSAAVHVEVGNIEALLKTI